MADREQLKKTAVKVLGCMEKVSSFASSINPLFGVVTSLVGVVRKGLVDEEDHVMDKEFCEIHSTLETISESTKDILKQIRFNEVRENLSKYEMCIKHQYDAFNTMVERIKKDPEHKDRYINDFVDVYEIDGSDMNLDVYYQSVMEMASAFGQPLLAVYLDKCNRNRKEMEDVCLHLTYLFRIGLIAFMAYTLITETEKEANKVRERWGRQIADIQDKMEETLNKCDN